MPGVDHAARRTYVRSRGSRTTERAPSGWPGTNQSSAVFPSPTGATSGVGFLGKNESTGASGARQKPRGFSERTGAENDSTAGRRCAAWSPSLGEIKWSTAEGKYARRRPCGAPDVCPKRGFPNNGAGHVPLGRERINRQRFSLPQPERQARWGFSGRANQPEPAGRGKKPRGFSERTGAENDSVAGRRCAAWSPLLGEIK
jgi:hypothetical protein